MSSGWLTATIAGQEPNDTIDRDAWPYLDEVWRRVEAGGIDEVWAQDSDRILRPDNPDERFVLNYFFGQHGTTLRAIDEEGGDSWTAGLANYAKWGQAGEERKRTAERSQRNRLQGAKDGKIMPSRYPPYGYVYDKATRSFEVEPVKAAHVRRIFEMVGAQGSSLSAVKRAFEAEGVPTPGGGRWHASTVRRIVDNPIYRTYSVEELAVMEGVTEAARLNPEARYGVYWWNRKRIEKRAGKRIDRGPKDRKDWVGRPVPDLGVPPEWVDAARDAVKDNVRPSNAGRRFWPLTSRVYCPCGRRHEAHTHWKPAYYYVCSRHRQHGAGSCEHAKYHNAEKLEQRVADFMLGLIRDPKTLRAQVTAQVEAEHKRLRNPEKDIAVWTAVIIKSDSDRARNQEMYRAGTDVMTLDELKASNAELEQRKATAQAKLGDRELEMRELEDVPRQVDAFLEELRYWLEWEPIPVEEYVLEAPEFTPEHNGLKIHTPTRDNIHRRTPEETDAERRRWQHLSAEQYRYLYDLLDLKVTVQKDGTLEITWRGGRKVLRSAPTPSPSSGT